MPRTNGKKQTSDFELMDEIEESINKARALATVGMDAAASYRNEGPGGEDLNLFMYVLRDEISRAASALSEFRLHNDRGVQLSAVPKEERHT